jgi:hypothetical protein
MVCVENCFDSNGRAISGLWEAVSIRIRDDGEQMLTLQNGPNFIEVPQRCCRGVMVGS